MFALQYRLRAVPSTRSRHAELLASALYRRGIHQQDLADALGVVPASLTKWLRYDRADKIPVFHWRTICTVLGIPWKTWVDAADEAQVARYRKIYGSLVR